MTKPISAEQAYINSKMATLPEVKEKKEYVLKRGDNLWSIAKRELNKKNASNKEISDYMLLIAKLNNMDTVEEMNLIKASQKIYLPGKVDNNKPIENKETLTQAQKSVLDALNTLQTDSTVRLERAKMTYGRCYHVYNEKLYNSGFLSKNHPVLSFELDASGNIRQITLEDSEQNLNSFGFDYSIDKIGVIRETKVPYTVKGILSKEQNEVLRSELNKLLNGK